MPSARLAAVPLALAAVAALSACGPGGAAASGDKLPVVASFYPLQLAAEQIGGAHVQVTGLTKPGAEPHDLELTPGDVVTVAKAKVVVYEKGLASAVDQAAQDQARDTALDVSPAAHLDLTYTPIESGQSQADAAGSTDPHFWLDPTRYSAVAQAIADRLATADPAHKADYEANAKSFEGKLSALDREFRSGLATCRRKDLVTSHNAFGYLAKRYGLNQVGITGLSPDAEPSPAVLADVAAYAKQHGVTTIYAETLVSPAIADTVARETGARVTVLDPIEGLTSKSAGHDYFGVMRSNLKALQAGQGCS
jgi:zinc transport system substrate-binding protein